MGGRGERERTGERIIRRGVGRSREWEGGGRERENGREDYTKRGRTEQGVGGRGERERERERGLYEEG